MMPTAVVMPSEDSVAACTHEPATEIADLGQIIGCPRCMPIRYAREHAKHRNDRP